MLSFTFPSSSSAGVVYTTLVHDGNVITCNCPGYTRRSVRECKHTKQVAAQLGITPSKVEQGQLFEAPEGFIKPMLASAMPDTMSIEDYANDEWLMEEKFDGHRLIVRVTDGEVIAWSRQGNVRRLSSALMSALRHFPAGTYDGELCIPGGTSTDVVALDKIDNACLYIFDVLTHEREVDVGLESYEVRRNILEATVSAYVPAQYNDVIGLGALYDVNQHYIDAIWNAGGEGVILKRKGSLYAPGKRSKDWVKVKRLSQATLRLIGFEEGLLGPHSKLVLEDEAGQVITVKALNDAWRAAFDADPMRYLGCNVVISYQERTRDGKYRHPMADHFPNGEL